MCLVSLLFLCCFCFFKRKTAYEMRISAWGSDVCSSGLFFLLAGRVLDAMMRDRARSGIAALLGRMGRGAHVAQPDGSTRWHDADQLAPEIGRASWRERGCQYESISVGAVSLQKQKQKKIYRQHSNTLTS